MKRLLVAVAAALAALAVAAPASAHNAFVSITCEGVTFTYSQFPSGQQSNSDQTVVVNGGTPIENNFVFTGPGDSDVVPLNIVGDATVVATFAWDSPSDDEQGSGGDSEDVSCGGETTTGATTGETTGQTTGETTGETTGATTGETTGETTGATTGGGTTGGGTTGSGGVIGATTGGTTGGSPGAETGGELPFTGLPVWIPVLLAFALLASGGFLLRRKRDDVS